MFVQILQGQCSDAAGVRRVMDEWGSELAQGAAGWLGTTAGVTSDGQFIGIARFASEEEARANSDRPEQGAWWEQFTKHFDGDVAVHDCRTAEVWLAGGSDDAGFVQVMQFGVKDRELAQSVMQQMQQMSPEDMGRSDVIGGTFAWHSDEDRATQVVYFTSEAEARAGEAQDEPPEAAEQFAQMEKAFTEPTYLDLTQPWLFSPS